MHVSAPYKRTLAPHAADTGVEFYRQVSTACPACADPNLVAPWGLTFDPFGFAWLSDHGSGVSTPYDGDARPQTPVVTVPPVLRSAHRSGKPTGIVWNGGPGFVVRQGELAAPARLIFACEDGAIAAWAPALDATRAVRVFPLAFASNARYTGLAIGADRTRQLLYAADFRNSRVDVFDTDFAWIILPGTPFVDPQLAPRYAPFSIQAINGDIYVTYAKQEADSADDVGSVRPAAGGGFVSVFTPDGRFRRPASGVSATGCWWRMPVTAPSMHLICPAASSLAACAGPMVMQSP